MPEWFKQLICELPDDLRIELEQWITKHEAHLVKRDICQALIKAFAKESLTKQPRKAI